MINELDLVSLNEKFKKAEPFNHVVIDNFFEEELANKIAAEFPKHDSDVWTVAYNNPVEVNRTELLSLAKKRYQEIMNDWAWEWEQQKKVRKAGDA